MFEYLTILTFSLFVAAAEPAPRLDMLDWHRHSPPAKSGARQLPPPNTTTILQTKPVEPPYLRPMFTKPQPLPEAKDMMRLW